MLTISPVMAFTDNYIWVLHNESAAIAVDPGDAKPLLQFLQDKQLKLEAVLITHHHADHCAGLARLKQSLPSLAVFGPADVSDVNQPCHEGDSISLLNTHFQVLATPGHTLDHLAYYARPWLFCGDTLFAAGCGRLFEGTPEQLFNSLERLASLPLETEIYCAHEYTLSNLRFAHAVEPSNQDIIQRQQVVTARRTLDLPSLPSTLALELASNPFLRCHLNTIHQAVEAFYQRSFVSPQEIFTALRQWKDGFK